MREQTPLTTAVAAVILLCIAVAVIAATIAFVAWLF